MTSARQPSINSSFLFCLSQFRLFLFLCLRHIFTVVAIISIYELTPPHRPRMDPDIIKRQIEERPDEVESGNTSVSLTHTPSLSIYMTNRSLPKNIDSSSSSLSSPSRTTQNHGAPNAPRSSASFVRCRRASFHFCSLVAARMVSASRVSNPASSVSRRANTAGWEMSSWRKKSQCQRRRNVCSNLEDGQCALMYVIARWGWYHCQQDYWTVLYCT